jgi:hypothetical protein
MYSNYLGLGVVVFDSIFSLGFSLVMVPWPVMKEE